MRFNRSANIIRIFLCAWLVTCLPGLLQAQPVAANTGGTIAERVNEAANVLSRYVAIPSVSGNENEAADYLKSVCKKKGLHVESISDTIGSVNFAASVYPLNTGKPNIILLNHIDVVQASDTGKWIYPPFSGTIADGKVWGRGAFDNKGLGITQLFSLDKFIDEAKTNDLPYNITLLSVSGEETAGITGSAVVAKVFQEKLYPAVVIGEGGSGVDQMEFLPPGKTMFGISVAEKGMIWMKLTCAVKSEGHSSISGHDYAVKRLVDALHRLAGKRMPIQWSVGSKQIFKGIGRNTGGIKGFAVSHINWFIFRPVLKHQVKTNPEIESILCDKITISGLKTDCYSTNQNPQEAYALLDCRYLPQNSPEKMIAKVKKLVKDTLISVSVERMGSRQYQTKPEFFYDELKKAITTVFPGADVGPILFPATTDNSYYRKSGCPVYGLNPMIVSPEQIQAIHNTNEYISLRNMADGIKVFEEFLESVEGGAARIIPSPLTHRR